MHKKVLILSFLLSSLAFFGANAQSLHGTNDKAFEVDFGLGFPDLLHVGAKYRITLQNKLGISYGSLLHSRRSPRSTNAVTLEHQYHFGKKGKYSPMPLFYASQKFTYLQDMNEQVSTRFLYFTPSIGKSFYSDGPFGLNIDVGINFKLADQNQQPLMSEQEPSSSFPAFFPALRLQFFFLL